MAFDTSTAEGLSTHRSSSRPPPDAIKPRLFPTTFSTTVFSQCTCGRFEASPRRATPEGQTTSITSTAPRSAGPPSSASSCLLRSCSQCRSPSSRPPGPWPRQPPRNRLKNGPTPITKSDAQERTCGGPSPRHGQGCARGEESASVRALLFGDLKDTGRARSAAGASVATRGRRSSFGLHRRRVVSLCAKAMGSSSRRSWLLCANTGSQRTSSCAPSPPR
jgi:hypothetical protein